MRESIFGWSYPPGCSGPPEPPLTAVELFEVATSNGEVELTETERLFLSALCENDELFEFAEKFAAWAQDVGHKQAQANDAEWWDCYAKGKLLDAGVSYELLKELRG